MQMLGTIAAALAQYHLAQARLERLNACSDAELAAMGMDRDDLPAVAWEEAERRFPLPEGLAHDAEDQPR